MRRAARKQGVFEEIQHSAQFFLAVDVQVGQAQRQVVGYDLCEVLSALDDLYQLLVGLRHGLGRQLLKLELELVLDELTGKVEAGGLIVRLQDH